MAGRQPRWFEDASLLVRDWETSRDAHAHDIEEAQVYLKLFYSRPTRDVCAEVIHDGDYRAFRMLGFNLLQEAANAVRSEVCKPLEVKLVPVGGTLKDQLDAELFNQLINARLESEKFIDLMAVLFLDAELCFGGWGIWEPDVNGDLRVRRLDPLGTFSTADSTELRTRRLMSRRLVMALDGDTDAKREAITAADQVKPDVITFVDRQTGLVDDEDNIWVYEGYLGPLGKLKGRHVRQLHSRFVLTQEDWDIRIPAFRVQYDTGFRDGESRSLGRTIGPYATWNRALGKSYYEQLEGARTVVKHKTGCAAEPRPKNWQYFEVDDPNDVQVTNLDAAISQETKAALGDNRDRALQEAGVNSGMAAGEPPPQFKSGLALQEWRKSLLSRLSQPGRQFEAGWTDSVRIAAVYYPRLYKNRKVAVKAANTGLLQQIDFASLNVSEKEANWTFQVVSGISLTDSGKLEVLGDVQQSGVIDALDVLEQLAAPDLIAIKEQVLAPRRLIQFQISQARDYNELVPPVDGQDFNDGAKRCSNALAAAVVKGIYPRAHLDKLRTLYHLFLARTQPIPPVAAAQPAAGAVTDLATAATPSPAPSPDIAAPAASPPPPDTASPPLAA